MAQRYKVNQNYVSNGLGPFEEGSEIELDDADAEFIERDSPGTLTPKGKRSAEKPPKDRMERGKQNRGAADREGGPSDAGAMTSGDIATVEKE